MSRGDEGMLLLWLTPDSDLASTCTATKRDCPLLQGDVYAILPLCLKLPCHTGTHLLVFRHFADMQLRGPVY